MNDLNLTALSAALQIAEADAEATGWGDESTLVFRVVGDPRDPRLQFLLRTQEYPVAAVDDWIADGLGMGSSPEVLGVVALSEAWRHLDDEELREAAPEAFDSLIVLEGQDPSEVWARAADTFRSRTRPRDMPDHLRAEVRVAVCVLRDGTGVQIVRDRGAANVATSTFEVARLPGNTRMPEAMMRLLVAPGHDD